VTDETSLRSIIRVDVRASKAKLGVPRIRRRGISRAERKNACLGGEAGGNRSLVRGTDIRELIADSVGDDVGVESLLLALVDSGVNGLKRELGGLAAVESSLELDGWSALAEVKAGDGGDSKGYSSSLCWSCCPSTSSSPLIGSGTRVRSSGSGSVSSSCSGSRLCDSDECRSRWASSGDISSSYDKLALYENSSLISTIAYQSSRQPQPQS
jgi:hypothetical protein